MNQLQRELYDRAKNAGGRVVIERVTEYPRLGVSKRAASRTTGNRDVNTMLSMLPPEGWAKHLPGGYRREIKFRLVEENKIDKIYYDKTNPIAQLVTEQYIIELI